MLTWRAQKERLHDKIQIRNADECMLKGRRGGRGGRGGGLTRTAHWPQRVSTLTKTSSASTSSFF